MADVFISHVEEDKEIALGIAEALTNAGVSVWYYERDSKPGLTYLEQITEAIDNAKLLVVIISEQSMGSHQVAREIEYAHDGNKKFLPVLVNVTQADFMKRRRDWHLIFGAATSIQLGSDRKQDLARIVDGAEAVLRADVKPIEPEKEKPKPAPDAAAEQPEPKEEDALRAAVRPKISSAVVRNAFDAACQAEKEARQKAVLARQARVQARDAAIKAEAAAPQAQVAAKRVTESGYGERTYVSPDGTYRGQIKNYSDLPMARQGSGVHVWATGEKYEGEWHIDKRWNAGIFFGNNGICYEGSWNNDMRHGAGMHVFADKTRFDGTWASDRPHEAGVCTWHNGDTFEGVWRNGERTGEGVYRGGPEALFIEIAGQFSGGTLNGYGAVYWKDGTVTVGIWEKGNLSGYAVAYDGNGQIIRQGEIVEKTSERLLTQRLSLDTVEKCGLDAVGVAAAKQRSEYEAAKKIKEKKDTIIGTLCGILFFGFFAAVSFSCTFLDNFFGVGCEQPHTFWWFLIFLVTGIIVVGGIASLFWGDD